MATVNFDVSRPAQVGGWIQGTAYVMSGQDAITTVENLEDASGDISLSPGDYIEISTSADIRVRFGGTAATATTGFLVTSAAPRGFLVGPDEGGTVSVIEGS